MTALLEGQLAQIFDQSDFAVLMLDEMTRRTEDDFLSACAAVRIAGKLASDQTTVDLLANLEEKLEALGAIQRILKQPRTETVDLGEKLQELCSHMVDARFAARNIFVQVRADPLVIDSSKAWSVLAIVHELMLAAFQRGFRDEPGVVSIAAGTCQDGISCLFLDDGTARQHIRWEERQRGQSAAAAIASRIGGTVSFPSCRFEAAVRILIPTAPAIPAGLFARLRSAVSRSFFDVTPEAERYETA